MQNHRLLLVAVVRFGVSPMHQAEKVVELALWARLQSGPKLKPWPVGAHLMARTPPPLGGVAFALALTSCARAGPLLAPISCLARAITPRAPSADRLRGAIGATQNTLQSLSCRGQYGCSVVKGVPPAPDCPCIALASCLAHAAHGLTDPHVHAQTTSDSRSFLLQWGAMHRAGLLACSRRAAGLQLSCCAPSSRSADFFLAKI